MSPADEAAAILTRDYPAATVRITNADTAIVELPGVTVCLHRWTEGAWTVTAFYGVAHLTRTGTTPDAALTALRARLREKGWTAAADLIDPQPAPERA